MNYVACPTALVNAPVNVAWMLLTDPQTWGDFFDVRIQNIDPPGLAAAGQVINAESGPRLLHLKVRMEYVEIDAVGYRLKLDVHLPLGIIVHEDLNCVPIDANHCRVNYHCAFDLPKGWRRMVARALLRRELVNGPADSLSRLKQFAERRHPQTAGEF